MPDFLTAAGQSPMMPGAVRAGNLVYTSGIAATSVLGGAATPFAEQAAETMTALLDVLSAVGAGPEHVVKLEAFLASADDFAAWNVEFLKVWPEPGPGRTTLIVGFALPTMLIELQAVAVVD
ncbi:hypothetical protein BH09ACT3_BH09ACT3_04570 [soil metagenome]